MSADKLVILTAEQYDERLIRAAELGAEKALAKFSQTGGAEKPVLSMKEATRLLGIGENTLYALVNAKRIPHFHIGRVIKFRRSELLGWEPPAPERVLDKAEVAYQKRKNKHG
jgi:excisionase family DNA binding protein